MTHKDFGPDVFLHAIDSGSNSSGAAILKVDVLLVNPWIYDFAAYDLWLRPYGLLKLGGLLRQAGYRVGLLDLLDPFHPELPRKPKRKLYGTGHFYRERLPKPAILADVPRGFARYGLPPALAETDMRRLSPPRLILLTALLTYWYPGALEAYRLLRKLFPQTPILLGGVYARLCPEHARRNFPEAEIVTESGEEAILARIRTLIEPSGEPAPFDYPVFDLQRKLPYVVLLTGKGCPFRCAYCASGILFPGFERRTPGEVFREILYWHERYGVVDFAFYDDALLWDFEHHLGPLLEEVCRRGLRIRFHTPNALHARFLTGEVARWLKRAGFVTLRLGLETLERSYDHKVRLEEFEAAVRYLQEAGYHPREIGVYLLCGLPGEPLTRVRRAAEYVARLGAQPILAEYSPVPGTPLFEVAREVSRYPLTEDPLYHNNSVFPAFKNPDWEAIEELKVYVRNLVA